MFNRRSGEKDDRAKAIEEFEIARLHRKEAKHVESLTESVPAPGCGRWWRGKQLATNLMGRKKGEVLAEAGHVLTLELLDQLPIKKLAGLFKNKQTNEEIQQILDDYDRQVKFIQTIYEQKAREGFRGRRSAPPA